MKNSFKLVTFIALAFAIFACGGDETAVVTDVAVSAATATREPTRVPTEQPEPTATPLPEPTATPLPEPTATALPEPTSEPISGTPKRFEEIGVALTVPEGWDSAEFFGSAFLTRDDDEDNAIIVFAEPLEEGATIDTMFDEMQSEIGEDESVTFGERVDLSVNGLEGFQIDFQEVVEGENAFGRIAFLTDGISAAAVVGRGTSDAWESGQSDAFNIVAQSVSLFEPIITESVDEDAPEEESAASGQEATDPVDDSAAPSKTTSAGAIAISGEAGMACFGTSGEGMSCISAEGEWQTYTEDGSQLPSDYITNIVTCSEDSLLIAHASGLSQFDGQSFRRYDAGWGFSSPDDLACDADGGIWAAHFEGVSYFDGSEWTTWDTDTYFDGDSLVNTVKIAPDGKVWVAASNTLASYDGANWTLYGEAEFGELHFFSSFVIDGSGVVWATTSDGLLFSEDGGWRTIDSPNYLSAETLSIDSTGNKWIGTFNDGIELYESGSWLTIDRLSGGLQSDRINDMQYDGSERLWIATEYGVAVRIGDDFSFYRMDNAPLIGNDISSVAVLGGGPLLPEPITLSPGGIAGVIVEQDTSVANRVVQLCVETIYSSYEGESPCEDQPFSMETSSDENGAFSFTNVPVGYYGIVVQTDEGWAQLVGEFSFSTEMVKVDAGEITDIGEFVVTDE